MLSPHMTGWRCRFKFIFVLQSEILNALNGLVGAMQHAMDMNNPYSNVLKIVWRILQTRGTYSVEFGTTCA